MNTNFIEEIKEILDQKGHKCVTYEDKPGNTILESNHGQDEYFFSITRKSNEMLYISFSSFNVSPSLSINFYAATDDLAPWLIVSIINIYESSLLANEMSNLQNKLDTFNKKQEKLKKLREEKDLSGMEIKEEYKEKEEYKKKVPSPTGFHDFILSSYTRNQSEIF